MQFVRNSLFTRSTTLFGVCEALGQDFKVNPTWFRVAFAAAVIFNLEAAILAYAAVGALVLVSRLIYPNRAPASDAAPAVAETTATVMAEGSAERALARAA